MKNLKFFKKFKKKYFRYGSLAGASSSHFGGALSIVEIISTLFSDTM